MQPAHQNSFEADDGGESQSTTSVATSFRQVRKAGFYKSPLRACSSRNGRPSRAVKFSPGGGCGGDSAAPALAAASEADLSTYESTNYRDRLADIRQTFPQPVSDRCHDAYFGFTIMRAIDQLDALKSKVPVLGKMEKNDYKLARQASMSDEGETVEEVNAKLVHKLEGKQIQTLTHERNSEACS